MFPQLCVVHCTDLLPNPVSPRVGTRAWDGQNGVPRQTLTRSAVAGGTGPMTDDAERGFKVITTYRREHRGYCTAPMYLVGLEFGLMQVLYGLIGFFCEGEADAASLNPSSHRCEKW
jgi:hypothetical protein